MSQPLLNTMSKAIRAGWAAQDSLMIGDWKVAIRLIGVHEATELLSRTHSTQRKVSQKSVEQYVRDLKADKFVLTPEPIIISSSGALIDGQHRLTAVVRSGIACRFMVVSNVDEATMPWLNIGRSRSILDVANVKGMGISNADIAIVTCLDVLDKMKISGHMTRNERLDLVPRYKSYLEFARTLPSIRVDGRKTVSAVPAALAWMSDSANESVEFLASRLAAGAWSSAKDPVFHLWKYLSGPVYESERRTPLGRFSVMAKVVRTVQFLEAGQENVGVLRVSPGHMENEWRSRGFGDGDHKVCGKAACELPADGLLCIVHRAMAETGRTGRGSRTQ